jgi:hypothetical protein
MKYMRITAAKMKYMRITAGYKWTYHRTNTEIAKELHITPVSHNLQGCKRKWIQLINRMPRKRLRRLIKTTPQEAEGTKDDH